MADNITDLSGLISMTFRAGWEAAYVAPEQLTDNGDGSYSIANFVVDDYSANPVGFNDFTLEVQDSGSGTLEIYIPDFDMTVAANVLSHSQETILIYMPDLDEYRLLLSDNWYNDPNYTLTSQVVNEGAGSTQYQGGISVSETYPSTPFDLPCFAEGTLIATPVGEVAIEALKVGDIILTASGAERQIHWIGNTRVQPGWAKLRGQNMNPVCIKAGAFGEGLPLRDLPVSPGHAVYIGGVLVPAGCFINGATIVQEQVRSIRYFHIELETHDVLLANGLPCESYLDDGNRGNLANAGEFGRLDPISWDDACAPIVAAGPQLVAMRRKLSARAQELGWEQCEDADLRLEVNGEEIAPMFATDGQFGFQVPPTKSIKLKSNSGVLRDMIPDLSDSRRLGIAVSKVQVDGTSISLDHAAFGVGFYALEQHDAIVWRWTNGEAELSLSLDTSALVEISAMMVSPSWKRSISKLTAKAA